MIARLFFVALFSVAFATKQVGDFLQRNPIAQDKFTDEETIRRLTEEAAEKARQIAKRADNVESEFASMTKDRFDSLMWQTIEIKTQLQRVIKDTVSRGMDKKKEIEAFQCIGEKGQDAYTKIDIIGNRIPNDTQVAIKRSAGLVMPYKYVIKEFYEYVEAYYQTKSQELKKATTDAIRKKILKEVMDKMNHVQSVLESVNREITDVKYKFFEDYIHYAFDVSNILRKTEAEEADKIKKCVP